jgi:hypothetical protein
LPDLPALLVARPIMVAVPGGDVPHGCTGVVRVAGAQA